jgi:O-methyltransferase involved in polyketide biosynthesis
VLRDEISSECLDKIAGLLPATDAKRLLSRKFSPSLARHIALRARKYDAYTREFLSEYPDGLVVSLGCGFDTRYWRVSDRPWKYIEIDLPNVIAAKREILKEKIQYPTIGCSVLEDGWTEEILAVQNRHVLFLVEGLFMYLPQAQVESLFKKLAGSFTASWMVFETVSKNYTQGIWKKMVELKMDRQFGTKAGSSYQFGLRSAKEIETLSKNLQVVEEWSYFEDPEIKPHAFYYFRRMKSITRTQWTIKVKIG